MFNELKTSSDRISLLTGFGRVCHGIQDLTKIQCRIQESLTREKHRCGIGKENEIRNSDDRSSGCGISCEKGVGMWDQEPPFPGPLLICKHFS